MAAITNQVLWRRVLNHVASDLKMLASIAAGEKITVEQATPANLEALVTLKGLRGIIPNPITATRIDRQTYVNGVSSRSLYAVGEDKRLFISSTWVCPRLSAAATSECKLTLLDSGGGVKTYFFSCRFDIAGQYAVSNQYWPAIELTYEEEIELSSDHANMDARGGFSGWLEDV